jgi:hypothetical protein
MAGRKKISGLIHRLEENILATEITLSADDLTRITAAISSIEVKGVRYNEQAQKMIDR